MSFSDLTDIQKMVFKMEPIDDYEQENCCNSDAITTSKSNRLRKTQNKVANTVIEKKLFQDGCDEIDNCSIITEKVQQIKRSTSFCEDGISAFNSPENGFPLIEDIKTCDSYAESVAHSCSMDYINSNLEKHIDQKPSLESTIYYKQLPHRSRTSRLSSKKKDKLCDKKFLDSEIMKPITDGNGGLSFYQCEICKKIFKKIQTLRQHFITHTDRFACPYCLTRCKSRGDLNRHIQTHTKEKPYHCDICNTDYTRESILKKHLKTRLHLRASNENLIHLHTRDNEHKKNTRDKIIENIAIVEDNHKLDFTCSQCYKVTYSKAEYRKHAKSHAFKYRCSICQKGCTSSMLLKIHKRSHNKARSLSCKVCTRSFANFYYLKEHVKWHKSGTSDNLAKRTVRNVGGNDTAKMVSDCPNIFVASAVSLSKAVKRLECAQCTKTFSSKRQLSSHKCVHDETYICGICTKTYTKLCKLKIHMKLHERILKCDICHVIFYDDKELDDHVLKIHIVKHEHTCRLCYHHFDKASDLEAHMNDHVPTMLFSGRSLDENILPVVNKTRRKGSGSNTSKNNSITEASRHKAKLKIPKSEVVNIPGCSDSDDDSILDSQRFYEILNKALDGSDDNLNDTEISDSDEEFYSGIKTAVEGEVMTSDESDRNESEEADVLKKPLIFGCVEILKKHCTEFERGSEKDFARQIFKCTFCDKIFHKDKYLKNHLKHHVCEYCNIFFSNKENLAAHKSHHIKQLLKQITVEAHRLNIPKHKWKGYLMASSESEHEQDDQDVDEFEDGPLIKAGKAVNHSCSLSHDEIVEANKHLFQRYSCLDPTNSIYACTLCKRKYARPTTLTRHFKTHICKLCNKFFKDKSDLREHKYSHHKFGEIGKTPSTLFVSKKNRNLFKKFSFVDLYNNIFRCTLCNKDFVRSTVLTRHLKTHICNHCDHFYKDKFDLVRHITYLQVKNNPVKSDGDDDIVENDESEREGSPNSSVAENMNSETNNITCIPMNPLSLPNLSSASQISPLCNNRDETITFVCTQSRDSSDRLDTKIAALPNNCKSSLQIVPRPVQIYKNMTQCSVLEASTSCEDSKPEINISASQKSEIIIQASQKSKIMIPASHKSGIMIQASHSQILADIREKRERPFECGECGKRFLKNDHLKSHMTIHTGDRPFVCCICGKGFGRSTILKKHMRTHNKQCHVCEAIFSNKCELDNHMEVHRINHTSIL